MHTPSALTFGSRNRFSALGFQHTVRIGSASISTNKGDDNFGPMRAKIGPNSANACFAQGTQNRTRGMMSNICLELRQAKARSNLSGSPCVKASGLSIPQQEPMCVGQHCMIVPLFQSKARLCCPNSIFDTNACFPVLNPTFTCASTLLRCTKASSESGDSLLSIFVSTTWRGRNQSTARLPEMCVHKVAEMQLIN